MIVRDQTSEAPKIPVGIVLRRFMAETLTELRKPLHIAVLFLIPLTMAAVQSDWLYTPIGYLDPWYNVGFFLHYGDAAFRTAHYKIGRLSWLLPGWVLYHVFRPVVANFVLHVGSLLLATVFVYLTLARLIARDLAFLAAVFLTIYFPFHASGGWDYQNAGVGAFYALTLYFLTSAAQSAVPRRGLFLTGMAYAATFHASILFLNMLPVLAAHYLLVRRNAHHPIARGLLRGAGWIVAGFAALTLVLGAINWSVGRQFLFFQPIVEIVFHYVKDPSHQKSWWLAWSTGWVLRREFANHLAVPFATLVLGSWVLVRRLQRGWRDGADPVPPFLVTQFIFLAGLWIVWQSLGQTALQPEYFAYPLIIPCILALAGLMAMSEGTTPVAASGWVIPCSLLCGVIPGVDLFRRLASPSVFTAATLSYEVPVFVVVAVILVVALIRARARLMIALGVIMIFETYTSTLGWLGYYTAADQCSLGRTAFTGLIAIDRFLHQVGTSERTWLWVGSQDIASSPDGCGFNVGYLRQSASSLGPNWLGNPSEASASQITEQEAAGIQPGDWVMLVTANPSQAADYVGQLKQLGKATGPLRQREITVAHTRLFVQEWPVILPVGDEVAQIPVDRLEIQANAAANPNGGGIELRTAPQRWAYSAITALTPNESPSGRLRLRVRLQVLRGEVSVLVAPNVSSPQVIEEAVSPTPEPQDIDIAIPNGSAEHLLVVRNWSANGPSLVRILKITMIRPPS